MATMNPAQTVGAGKTPGKYPYEVTKTIAGSAGKTLLECIQGGILDKPPAMAWNEWQDWRRSTSPKKGTDGFTQDSTIERGLHLAVMEALYGTLWETQLQPTGDGLSAITSEPLGGAGATRLSSPGGSAAAPGDGGTHTTGAAEPLAPAAGEESSISGGADGQEPSASSTMRGSPRRDGSTRDILQDNDPWEGRSLPGSRATTPTQSRRAPPMTSLSPGSQPSIPPGLGEPRRSDYSAEDIPVPGESPTTPRRLSLIHI